MTDDSWESRFSSRMLTLADCATLAALHETAFSPHWTETEIRQVMELTGSFGIGLTLREDVTAAAERRSDRNRLIGFVMIRLIAPEAEILTLAVDRSFRGQGGGRYLMMLGCSFAMMHDVEDLFLEVATDNEPARSLYQSMGFEIIGKRKGYYDRGFGRTIAALTMKKLLVVPDELTNN